MNRMLEMEVFIAVVDQDSFIAAADALRMSKTAVSRYVSALEERLGVRLLQRTTRRLSLTGEGRLFYQRAKDILASLDEAETEVASRLLEPAGLIRVNVPVTFGIQHLAPLWADFLKAHPKVELDINLNDRLVDLVDEGYDLVVRIARLESSSLVGRRLATTRMRLCASPGYLRAHAPPRTPQELAGHTIIAYNNLASGDEWTFHGPVGEVSVKTRATVYCNNGDTCRAIALRDGGILLQPSFMIQDDLRRGDLIELMPEYRAIELDVNAVFPSRKQLPVKVRRLIDFLVSAFAAVDWDDSAEDSYRAD